MIRKKLKEDVEGPYRQRESEASQLLDHFRSQYHTIRRDYGLLHTEHEHLKGKLLAMQNETDIARSVCYGCGT